MLEAIAKVISDAVRSILFMLDQVVYGFIPTLYKLIISLANVDLYTGNSAITALLNRVYIIVGIFMLFKLAFSVLRYIVDPGSFSDQAKGFTGLVKRLMIAIVLLVTVPYIFKNLYDWQGKILSSGVLSNLILGTSESESSLEGLDSAAKDLQFIMFGPFYSLNINDGFDTFSECKKNTETYPLSNIVGSTDMALNGDCLQQFSDAMQADQTVKASGTTLDSLFKTSDQQDSRDFNKLAGLLTWSIDGQYAINYTPIISTICGGYLAFLLLSFCIDVAARAIKLLFLQILSPIAIVTSVDPTSSSQNDKLKEWGSECLKTFLALFLRLAVIYVIIQLIKIITAKLFSGPTAIYYSEFAKNNAETIASLNIFVYIFLILGAFSVAKKIPELLEKALGIKMSGEMSLNPFKTFTQNAGFGLLAGAATGAVAGGLSGGISAFSTAMNNDKGLGRSLLSGAGGIMSGGTTGTFRGGRARGGKGWEAGMQSGGRIARRMEVREATGGARGVPSMTMDRLRDKMGAPTIYQSMENRASRYDDVTKELDEIKSRATDQLSKKSNAWKGIQAQRTAAEEKLRNGTLTHEKYVEAINDYYQQEQSLIAKYIDSNGKDFGGGQVSSNEDGQMSLRKQAFRKAVKDTRDEKLIYETEKDARGNIVIKVDSTGKPTKKIDLEKASWSELGADGALLKTNAEQSALEIRKKDSYNDAFDRDAAIHGARLDAHQKH